MAIVIGIDLGTTNTVVAVVRNGRKEIIRVSEQGDTLIPSVVCVNPMDPASLLVGREAKAAMMTDPRNAVCSTKRLMGMTYFDPELGCPPKREADYQRFLKVQRELPFKLYPDPEGKDDLVRVKLGGRYFKPEDIAALILKQAKEAAEAALHDTVSGVVITTPAYFEDKQREATRRAAQQAGLRVLALMDEPNAAAMSAGCSPEPGPARWVLVFDFGGGTLDVSLLQISKDTHFRVYNKGGDNWLGGDDYDTCLIELVEARAREVANVRPDEVFELLRSVVKREAEAAKIELSTKDKTVLNVASCALVRPAHGGEARLIGVKNLEVNRDTFEKKTRPLLARSLATVDDVLKAGPQSLRSVIRDVLLIGGSTYIPSVRQALKEQFPGKVREDDTVNPMHEVALGAAIYADALEQQINSPASHPVRVISDTVPQSLGIEVVDAKNNLVYEKLILRQTPLTKAKSEERTFHVTRSNYLSIPVYEGDHEEATKNRLQGRIQVDINPHVNIGHPVHIRLEVTPDRTILVYTRIDGRDEMTHSLNYVDPDGNENDIEMMEEMVSAANGFLNQYGDYIEDKQKVDLNALITQSATVRESKNRLNAITIARRIKRLIFYTDQVGNQLFQAEQLAHAPLSQARKDMLRDLSFQARALYDECKDNPTPERKSKLKQLVIVFETFLGMAFREAAGGSRKNQGLAQKGAMTTPGGAESGND